MSLFAGTKGFLDDIPLDDVGRFERELLEEFRSRYSELLGGIKESGKLPDEDALKDAVTGFKERFRPSDDSDDDKKAEAKKDEDTKSEDKAADDTKAEAKSDDDTKAEDTKSDDSEDDDKKEDG